MEKTNAINAEDFELAHHLKERLNQIEAGISRYKEL